MSNFKPVSKAEFETYVREKQLTPGDSSLGYWRVHAGYFNDANGETQAWQASCSWNPVVEYWVKVEEKPIDMNALADHISIELGVEVDASDILHVKRVKE